MHMIQKFLLAAIVLTALLATSSCAGDDPVGPPEMETVGNVVIPENTMAFISMNSYTSLKKLIGDLGSAMGGSVPASSGSIDRLLERRLLGTTGLEWMATERPLKLMLLDPEKNPKPFVTMVPFESKKALLSSLGSLTKKVDGNQFRFTSADGKTMYVNIVGKNAVFTMDAAAFPGSKEFIEGDLLKYPATQPLDVQTKAISVAKVVQPVAAIAIQRFLKALPVLAALTGKGTEQFLGFMKDLDRIRVVATFSDGNLVIESSATPRQGTAIAAAAAGAKDRRVNLMGRAPGDGWLEIAANADPDDVGKTIQKMLSSIVAVVGLSSESKDVYPRLLNDIMKALDGESLVWVGSDEGGPMKIQLIAGLTSSEAARTASGQMLTLLLSEFGKKISVLVPPSTGLAATGAKDADGNAAGGITQNIDVSKLDWTSMATLVSSWDQMLSTSGLKVALKSDSGDGIQINYLDFDVDPAALARAAPSTAAYGKLLGEKFSMGVGFDDRYFYAAAGSDAVKSITSVRGQGNGSQSLSRIVSAAGFDVTWAMRLSIVDIGMFLAPAYGNMISALAPAIKDFAGKPEVTVISGSKDGRTLVGRLSLPISGIADLRTKQTANP